MNSAAIWEITLSIWALLSKDGVVYCVMDVPPQEDIPIPKSELKYLRWSLASSWKYSTGDNLTHALNAVMFAHKGGYDMIG